MWLHLVCGLSKLNCKRARDDLVERSLSVSGRFGFNCKFDSSTSHDVRAMNKRLSLEASFERYVCCLKCFSLYDIETAPDNCGYQAASKSKPCGAELFKSNPVSGILKTQHKNQIQNDGLVQPLGKH
ncbi:hypothetical protein O181_074584 [Austropuccinia psidii MF-1]|uniref:Uncharacterized protein n=1 Tax=Austropuccinia psidii MF-1 TaxID=1389203 RepID=A0A9Q3F8V6_9BASI|nr:hypothetical protein [Austropuccinia psidii MF-1]